MSAAQPRQLQWYDIRPGDAVGIDLSTRTDITAPLNECGERCPWPWEPQQLIGHPIGQYHCGYCGAMVLAGVRHLDYGVIDMQRWLQGDELKELRPTNDKHIAQDARGGFYFWDEDGGKAFGPFRDMASCAAESSNYHNYISRLIGR